MTLQTSNLSLPYIAPAQAQKHVTHNEALRMIDALVQLSVSAIAAIDPASPNEGDRVLIGPNPQGTFEGRAHQIAAFQDGAWAFFTPQPGWRTFVGDQAVILIFDGLSWTAPTANVNPVDFVGVNATADTTNRLSVKSPATLLDHEGAGHQLKLNKSQTSDTGSVLFQTGYSAHAELGLTGDNNFRLKVSSDGANFETALAADQVTGDIYFPNGFNRAQMTSSVDEAGGPNEFYGPPNLSTSAYSRGSQSLVKNRIYFTALYVDRPTTLTGGFLSLHGASSASGAVTRCGIYHLGAANGDDWDLGDLVVDFGAQAADVADNKIFNLATPIELEPGWYACAVGTDGDGVSVRYARTLTPGVQHFSPYSSGASSDIRMAGAGIYLYSSGAGSEITNGLSAQWPDNPVEDMTLSVFYGQMMFIPRWEVWT